MTSPFSSALPLSVLDLAHVVEGFTPAEALRDTLDLAKKVEELGYRRFWVAEHHGTRGVASCSPPVLIAHLADATSRIRVGSGGVMLPNHAPLVAAEQFGTLEALHPGRIDLGIGRAPGTDPATQLALRRSASAGADFPAELDELIGYFEPGDPGATGVLATTAAGNRPETWLLGSSPGSARLAAKLGLPYAYAHHFNPHATEPALRAYRDDFVPSPHLAEPYALVAALVVTAETDEHARWLAAPNGLNFLRFRHGDTRPFPTAEAAADYPYTPVERELVDALLGPQLIGTPDAVVRRSLDLLEDTGADELMALTMVHDHQARIRSFELLAKAFTDAAVQHSID